MKNNFLKNLVKFVKSKNTMVQPQYKIHPQEFFIDKNNQKPYIMISPIIKHLPHKVYIEEIFSEGIYLTNLNHASLCYINQIYGMINTLEHNNLFKLSEINPISKDITVRCLKLSQLETWDYDKFLIDYQLLDKISLFKACAFFTAISDFDKSLNLEEIQGNTKSHLKLVK